MDPKHGEGESELFRAQSHLYKHIFNYISSMSLKCAVQLGIPGIIYKHARPITLPELVTALEVHPAKSGNVYRLMRLLVHSGFFSKTKVLTENDQEEEAYALTPSSRLLIKDESNCLSPFLLSMLDPAFLTSWHSLGGWFRGNELTPFESAHGVNFWDYGEQNSEFNNLFGQAMASDSQMVNLVVQDCKPIFEGLDSLVDVGGGTGSFSRIISAVFPHMNCTVFDLPHIVANLPESKNLKFKGGDMFQSIPPADAFLFKLVFHAFGDEDCVKVLKKCREATASKGKGGKVIIIDIVIDEKKDEHELTEAKLFFDMLMMVVVTGRERNEKEWERLILEAGFSGYKITPFFGLRSIIEVYP
ncbi:trans-resveratrol di-O-methyltransferase-like [Pistacia vera]|uniref:trans-resveratrol di-O-methyltransferase-like n=1 Tax=Pistacia vera TaxID=55513 RepID=UPI0012630224|nr:trans-resveratrol di-O-methyltransferase-like [Pistacia vera]